MIIKDKTRDEVEEKYKWDLSKIYISEDEWLKDFEYVKANGDKYLEFKGRLNNADSIYEFLKFDEEFSKKSDAVYMYAALKFDEDTSNSKYQELKGKIEKVLTEISTKTAFVIPELLKLSKEDFDRFMNEKSELKMYEYEFRNILRTKDHILSDSEEELLSSLGKSLNNPEDTASYLRNSDMKFGVIKDGDGNEVELSNINFSKYIMDNNREVRKSAFYTLYKEYENLQNTFASSYSGKVNTDNVIALRRGYKDAREAALFDSNIDGRVYDNLIDVLHHNLNIMDDYYALKKEVMGLDELHIYDIYGALVPDSSKSYTFEEAKNIVMDALSILGDNYINDLKKAFDEKWIDVMPSRGKKGGAYSWGCYTSCPYLLLNFNGKFDDVSTLAHELGHSMHSYYSNKNNPYIYHQYKIFVAEVASQVNELILARYLINHTDDKNEKLAILDSLMELFKGSIVRQTMFAEFEDLMHRKEQDGYVLTSEFISDNYYELYKKYSGNNMISDKEIRYEWEKIPHFYYNFYVYQYATGLAAASYIATKIMSGDKEMLNNYLKFLTLGGSMDPIDELKVSGVDMNNPDVIQSAMDMFKDLIDEFKEIYRSR
ncbi:oligoendopeptidase F [Firmicutes bacterium CAG:822]|nr:oligoendopeptidase F [Firmicutes bacterium CAG:822]